MMGTRKSGGLRPESELEKIVEDNLEEEHGPLNKRSRLWSSGNGSLPMAPDMYNPLDEPGPLGLRLSKSPSLLELIQMRLSGDPKGETLRAHSYVNKESKGVTFTSARATLAPGSVEKIKASNFPASLLKFGNWEYKSRHEGNMVAKFYFAKQKIVWEVLEQGLKSKIEIQWSDIVDLKANCPEDGPGTLTLMLARPPLFFRETNLQPRKHTFWLAASDFTDGQASMNRRHILQCAEGILNKHVEKLVQCDHRLFHLSQQPEITMDSRNLDAWQSIFEDPSVLKVHPFGNFNVSTGPSIFGTQNLASPAGAQSSSEHMYLSHEALSPTSVIDTHINEEIRGAEAFNSRNRTDCGQIEAPGLLWTQNLASPAGAQSSSEHMYLSHEALLPSSVIEAHVNEGIGGAEAVNSRNRTDCEQIESPGPPKSMSLGDFLDHLSDTKNITEDEEVAGLNQSMSMSDFAALLSDSRNVTDPSQIKVTGLHQSLSVSDFVGLISDSAGGNHPEHMETFENMKQQLLSDNMQLHETDEKSLMPRVNSLFNHLYKDHNVAANSQLNMENSQSNYSNNNRVLDPVSSSKPQAMLRKDSFSDFLLHLPQIPS